MKESYDPSEKRFQISDDKISRDRLSAVVKTYDELKEYLPGIPIGFSLFGSLSKGRRLQVSDVDKVYKPRFGPKFGNEQIPDIDLICYYDADAMITQHSNLMLNNADYATTYRKEMMLKREESDSGVPDTYSKYIEWLNSSTLETILNSFIVQTITKRNDGMFAPVHLFISPVRMEGADSIMDIVMNRGDSMKISGPFHLDVGGGLKPYRQAFLEQLSKMEPEKAERAWKRVNWCVRFHERKGVVPAFAKKQFPATFKEAVAYYGLPKEDRR